MNEPKCTPGEWMYGVRDDGSMWLSLGDPVTGPHYQGDLCAGLDDARLIVAAKDLYEALAALMSDNLHSFPAGAPEMALAALAKARGE